MSFPKIAFIGAGSTVFMKNIVGDVLQWEALKGVHFSLMDINEKRLSESEMVFKKLVSSLEVKATYSLHTDQKEALREANFVVVAFQIGGFEPCTCLLYTSPSPRD